MQQYEKLVERYQLRQAKLRKQIASLKAARPGTHTAPAVQRIERQVTDLERAIARCRENVERSKVT
jgi:hypothetical protein